MIYFRRPDQADDTASIAIPLRNQNLLSAWTSMPCIVPSVLRSQVFNDKKRIGKFCR